MHDVGGGLLAEEPERERFEVDMTRGLRVTLYLVKQPTSAIEEETIRKR